MPPQNHEFPQRYRFVKTLRFGLLSAGLLAIVNILSSPNPSTKPTAAGPHPAPPRENASATAPPTPPRSNHARKESTASTRTALGALLDGAVKLSSEFRPAAHGTRRISFYRTALKYPLVRVVEDFENGITTPTRKVAMVADHVLVRAAGDERRALDDFLTGHPELAVRSTLRTGEHVLLQIPDAMSPDALDAWQKQLQQAGLRSAGPDWLQQHCATPNDTGFSQLWGLHNTGQNGGTVDADIDAPEAWNITTGSNNVIVGVIDCGVDYNHPDLAANIWTNAAGKHGLDAYGDDDDPMDDSDAASQGHGHGTHVSGTIAGVGNNSTGVTGVNWHAKIMCLRFIGPQGTGMTSDAIDCLRYATDNGAKITNNSWGGGGGAPGDSMQLEIERARDHGVLFIVAAGNGGDDRVGDNMDGAPEYPACYNVNNIVSVAATDRNDAITSFSNYGAATVDIAAPGQDIRSALPGNTYGLMSGTSMACPHVSGVAALILAANNSLTFTQIRTRIINNDDNLAALSGKCASGGRLNAYKTIQDLAGPVLALTRKNAVTTGGNGDAYPNPGETVRLDLTLENTGSETATAATIAASLSSGAPATLNRASLSVGTLASLASSAQDDAFAITLNDTATLPATFTVNFTLSTSAGATTWADSIQITVYESATVRGLVARAGSGAPLSGAAVAVRGPVNLDLTTGADGRYSAPAVAGSYQLTARAIGLVDSATRTETVNSAPEEIDFALGTASLSLAPATVNITVPPGQTRNLTAVAAHTGDSPRAIPFQTSITGSGLAADKLYGLDTAAMFQGGAIKCHEINPATGAITASHDLPLLGQQERARSSVFYQGEIWLFIVDYSGSQAQRLRPLDPATWTFGATITLTPPAGVTFNGLSATDDRLLLFGSDNNFNSPLYEYNPATGVFTLKGTLPENLKNSIAYSKSRSSVFLTTYAMDGSGETIRELDYPALTEIRQWSAGTSWIEGLAYNEKQSVLFAGAYSQSSGTRSLTKRNPDTGAVVPAFTAVAGVTMAAVSSASGAGWISTTLATTDVATGGTRAIPLAVDTTGMTLGQTFSAQLHVTSSLASEPAPVTVNLTVGNLDPGVWDGWFETRFGRSPQPADRLTDADHDGIPTYLEFATGGDPENPAPHAGQPRAQLSANGTALEFTYYRRNTLAAGALIAQTSADLAAWSALPAAVSGASQTTSQIDSTYDRVVITIPLSANARLFVRLAAS